MYNRTMKVPLAASRLRDSDLDLVTSVVRSGNLTMGNEIKNLKN